MTVPATLRREFHSWQGRQFYEPRIEILRQKLTETNVFRFESMTYDQKCLIVSKLVVKGAMI